ncbi:MAG TPA: hypothetical protein VGX25_25940 [Actinophytocola sp.]|uniref:hypothetical protein n=1 Tax=Actinophytocola sp. TaxID=1872138 RepID=UPI002DDD1370|nr:hypothetical protein [Actinophytocola sp.]HEV2782848.1 hypothetical protein [Actinophytocola sp.]
MRRALGIAGLLTATVATVLGSAATAHATLPPRTVQPAFTLLIHDEEDWPWSDEVKTFRSGIELPNESSKVVRETSPQTWSRDACWGDEVRVRITFTANLDVTGRVQSRSTMDLFEDTSCFATDHDGSKSQPFPSQGASTTVPMFRVLNQDPDEYDTDERQALDCDYAELTTTFTVF